MTGQRREIDMSDEAYYSGRYVNWMRHLLYRDALQFRLHRRKLDARLPSGAGSLTSIKTTQRT